MTYQRLILLFCFISLSVSVTVNSGTACADVMEKELKIVAKVLNFVNHKPTGIVPIDVIYNPENSDSISDANKVSKTLGAGLKFGNVTLKGNKATHSTGAKVAYIATGAEGATAALHEKGVLTVSLEPECAISGKCVLAITSVPKVSIHINKQSASASGTKFAPAFRMMVTQH